MTSIIERRELKILGLIFILLFSYWTFCGAELKGEDYKNAKRIVLTAKDIIRSTYRLMDEVEFIKQDNQHTAQFEVGFLMFMLFEKYRMMVDKYNTSHKMKGRLFTMELVMYLEDIENHYWEVEHIVNMLHEIERKYGINSSLYGTYHELTSAEKKAIAQANMRKPPQYGEFGQKPKKRKPFVLTIQTSTDIKKVVDGDIFNELSWSVKLMLLKDHFNSDNYATTQPTVPTKALEVDGEAKRRIPGIELLVAERRQNSPDLDDNNMRLKLFRLMYENIRDSDLKCKRAELIRTHYVNSSVFEIGYLMGDVMDKFNIMSDISMTLNRLFHEWKPIEHINAYEQISNQAIEINHLVDLMRGISRKNESTTS